MIRGNELNIQRVKRTKSINIRSEIVKYRHIYYLIIPAVIFYFIFSYVPMYGITMAFREYKFNKGLLFSPFIGFKYFQSFFGYYDFWNIIKNTLVINFFKLVLYFPIPIIFALMLNEVKNSVFKKVIQTVSYLPFFISWVIVVVILQQFLSLDGIINQVRASVGMDKIFFMNDSKYFYLIMFLSYIWKSTGFGSILYLAAISNIDQNLYEAAIVDGARKLHQIWHITLPSIAPTIIIVLVLSLGSVMNAGWDQIYLLRTPGNSQLSNILDTYVIQTGLREGQFGYATAVSLFQSVIGLVMVIISNRISGKISENSLF